MIDRALLVRAAALYGPVLLAAGLGSRRRLERRHSGALLLSFLWCLPSLLVVQLLNLHFGWWSFHAGGGLLRSMPADLYLGWAVLWGVLPELAFSRQRLWMALVAFLGLDLIAMPACAPVIELSHSWLAGELAAICLVFLPAQLFARWTLNDTHLHLRVWMQVAAACGIFMFLPVEIVAGVTGHDAWEALLSGAPWLRNLELQLVFLLAAGGISATQEFAGRGLGTPVPYDPPRRLVVSGLYRYLANPMQLFCALTLTSWGAVLHNPWITGSGAITIIYSVGLARWDEGEDLEERFGASWLLYRRHVRNWIPRWRPWHGPNAPVPCLYVAEACGPCSQVRRWLEDRNPVALTIVAAEDHPSASLTRITYDPMDGTPAENGVAAFARALEHLHFGWAWLGAVLRLPWICHLTQWLLDAGGLGPQPKTIARIPRTATRRDW
jgi:protein-S-isoprenylcysteine O-methyltransferase Ste14